MIVQDGREEEYIAYGLKTGFRWEPELHEVVQSFGCEVAKK